jgi:hypothetical protein
MFVSPQKTTWLVAQQRPCAPSWLWQEKKTAKHAGRSRETNGREGDAKRSHSLGRKEALQGSPIAQPQQKKMRKPSVEQKSKKLTARAQQNSVLGTAQKKC